LLSVLPSSASFCSVERSHASRVVLLQSPRELERPTIPSILVTGWVSVPHGPTRRPCNLSTCRSS
jgi:hypothetical protein